MTTLEVFIPGHPKTKGSWVGIPTKDGVVMKGPKGEKAWRNAVAWMVKIKMTETGFRMIARPYGVSMRLIFVMPKPKTSINEFPRGDIDKLMRSVLDALTGIAYEDDVQVSDVFVEKGYVVENEKVGLHLSLEKTL